MGVLDAWLKMEGEGEMEDLKQSKENEGGKVHM